MGAYDPAFDDERPRFLSEDDCRALGARLARLTRGGGYTTVKIASTWRGNLRWARNQITTGGEVRDHQIEITRNLNGGQGSILINDTTDQVLAAAAQHAERIAQMHAERPQVDLVTRLPLEPHAKPQLFSEATYQLSVEKRASAAISLARTAADAGMLSAGDIEVVARSLAILDTEGRTRYFPYTLAQYRVTVRDPKGTGSGWAGVDQNDWAKIDTAKLTAIALDKCLRSQNPVRVEPGRYTVILEPQAVADLVGGLFYDPLLGVRGSISLQANIYSGSAGPGPFNKEPPSNGPHRSPGYTRLGERVIDERITISADPLDPELGFPPFSLNFGGWVDQFTAPVYHKATWIDKGILTRLAYSREEAIAKGESLGLPNSGAFRISVEGPVSTIDEMIAMTKRGILVTRFDPPTQLHWTSQLYRGYTRDGLWFIENGKISKPIKNLVFTDSPLFALNNIEQLGAPQRVYHGGVADPFDVPQPRIAPALKVRDFSFTALTDAV